MNSLFESPPRGEGYMPEAKSTEWGTPWHIFRPIHEEFSFTLDVAARKWNTKIPDRYFTPELNGLGQSWRGETAWCNPPYGADNIALWLQKALYEREQGTTTVLLLPSTTETKWFHHYVWDAQANRPRPGIELRFFEKRITFIAPPGMTSTGNVKGSILVIVRPIVPGVHLPCHFCGK
jgi:phage N-6-adenine-methyltransferase